MINKFFNLLAFLLLVSSFIVSPTVYAQESSTKMTGYGIGRTRFILADANGGPPPTFVFPVMSRMYNSLRSLSNFGPNGFVKCSVTGLDTLTDYVTQGSLVDSQGELLVDIFWGPAIDTNLTDEEANELSEFVRKGGVLFVSGAGWQDNTPGRGPEYNLLFEKLGLPDRFDTFAPATGRTKTQLTLPSIITQGPFGDVGDLELNSYRRFNEYKLNGIIYKDDPKDFVVLESRIGKGYLIVVGSALFTNGSIELDSDNLTYFLNMFALGCDKSWQDNSVVLDVPSFKQGLPPYDNVNPNWETHIYDHGNELDLWCDTNKDYASIAECGCALTSASMVMNYHGVINAPGGFFGSDPFGLNSFANGFFPSEADGVKGFFGGNFNWHYVDNFSAAAAIENNNQKVEFASRENFNVERIKQLIDEGKPVIVNVIGPWGEHWVVVKGYDPDDNRLIINDPAKEDPIFGQYSYLDELYTPKPNNSMIVYQKTNSDFRRLQFVSTSENHLLVSDSLGNKTGYDPDVGHIVDEIPNSSYVFDNYYGDPTHPDHVDPSTDGIYFLTVELPEDSEYKLQILSQDSEFHPVQIYSSDVEGGLAGKVINPDETIDDYTLTYKEETAGQEVNATEDIESIFINIDVEPFIKTNVIIPHKLFSVPVAILANDSFDVSKVIITSLTFGKTGLENSLIGCSRVMLDVNRDRKKDLICYFAGNKLGVDLQDKEIILKGIYDGEIPFDGKDKVTVIKPWFLF